MSDFILMNKISDTITNIFKKIENTNFYIGSFSIVSSIIGLTGIYINYCNLYKIKTLEKQIKCSKNVLKYNIEINRKQYQMIYNKLIEQLKNELQLSRKFLEQILEFQYSKPEILLSSITTPFSPIKFVLPSEKKCLSNPVSDTNNSNNNSNNNNDDDYDELENECYDSIPMNNLKKNIGLNWFFK